MRHLLALILATLTGCSMIPYETPEARTKIEHDLEISPQEIIGITETNWCAYNYGDPAQCRATQGLGVLTTKGLILSLYKSKTYHHAFTLKAENIRCTYTFTSKDTPEIFYAFTDSQTFMLAPITPGGQMNLPMKIKMYDYLNKKGASKLVGKNISFTKNTGEREYSGSIMMVGNTPVPYATSDSIHRVVNPCST